MLIAPLSPEQYPILAQIADGFVPDPDNSLAVVAWDDETPVGRMLLVAMPHVEGTWIAESHRGGTLGVRLMKAIEFLAKERGLKKLMAYTTEPTHTDYMTRLGWTKTNFTVLTKEL